MKFLLLSIAISFSFFNLGDACFQTRCKSLYTKEAKCAGGPGKLMVQSVDISSCPEGHGRYLCCPEEGIGGGGTGPEDYHEDSEIYQPDDDFEKADGRCVVSDCHYIFSKFKCPRGASMVGSKGLDCHGPFARYMCCNLNVIPYGDGRYPDKEVFMNPYPMLYNTPGRIRHCTETPCQPILTKNVKCKEEGETEYGFVEKGCSKGQGRFKCCIYAYIQNSNTDTKSSDGMCMTTKCKPKNTKDVKCPGNMPVQEWSNEENCENEFAMYRCCKKGGKPGGKPGLKSGGVKEAGGGEGASASEAPAEADVPVEPEASVEDTSPVRIKTTEAPAT